MTIVNSIQQITSSTSNRVSSIKKLCVVKYEI